MTVQPVSSHVSLWLLNVSINYGEDFVDSDNEIDKDDDDIFEEWVDHEGTEKKKETEWVDDDYDSDDLDLPPSDSEYEEDEDEVEEETKKKKDGEGSSNKKKKKEKKVKLISSFDATSRVKLPCTQQICFADQSRTHQGCFANQSPVN